MIIQKFQIINEDTDQIDTKVMVSGVGHGVQTFFLSDKEADIVVYIDKQFFSVRNILKNTCHSENNTVT